MQQLDVKLSAFEGPLDVLCHLIQKNEIDIYDIPIALLTDQYLEFVKDINFDLMESMSGFVVMGATLLEIKSRMLLPGMSESGESPEDMRNALIAKLVEYKAFKELAEKMSILAGYDDLMCFRTADNEILLKIAKSNQSTAAEHLEDITIKALFDAYKEILLRKKNSINEAHMNFGNVAKELFSINDKINSIIDILSDKKSVSFKRMFSENVSKEEKIVTFLAVLELIKMKLVNIRQNVVFGDIVLKKAAS